MNIRTPATAMILTTLALVAMPTVKAQTELPWCAANIDGAMNCVYNTLSDCEQWTDGECIPNPNGEIN